MINRNHAATRGQVEIVGIDDMVLKEHLLRKIGAAVDFGEI